MMTLPVGDELPAGRCRSQYAKSRRAGLFGLDLYLESFSSQSVKEEESCNAIETREIYNFDTCTIAGC